MATELKLNTIYHGDTLKVLKTFPDECVDTIITSPPYWGLRDYGIKGQIGLEASLDEFLSKLLAISFELKRILKKTGVMWWNHADSYASYGTRRFENCQSKGLRNSSKRSISRTFQSKCMMLQNYRLIQRMVDEQSWILRNHIIWHKSNYMPSSVKDRFSNAYESVFMLVKNQKYWFDLDTVRVPHKPASLKRIQGTWNGHREPMSSFQSMDIKKMCHRLGKNPGDVWRLSSRSFAGAHFATFPERLIEPMIKSSCPERICQQCGHAPKPIVETVYQPTDSKDSHKYQRGQHLHRKTFLGPPAMKLGRALAFRYMTGKTQCDCNAEFQPGVVLDPFMGSGTTAVVAERFKRHWVGIELNPKYIELAEKRIFEVTKSAA